MRQFARHLKKFNTELRERLGSLNRELHALGTTWRDQEHKRFTEEFEEHLRMIARFLESADRHVPYLAKKADQIDEYLQS
ncbi:MAG: WXG100 family type VII secretion target [Pirellulaceae bacterium]